MLHVACRVSVDSATAQKHKPAMFLAKFSILCLSVLSKLENVQSRIVL